MFLHLPWYLCTTVNLLCTIYFMVGDTDFWTYYLLHVPVAFILMLYTVWKLYWFGLFYGLYDVLLFITVWNIVRNIFVINPFTFQSWCSVCDCVPSHSTRRQIVIRSHSDGQRLCVQHLGGVLQALRGQTQNRPQQETQYSTCKVSAYVVSYLETLIAGNTCY